MGRFVSCLSDMGRFEFFMGRFGFGHGAFCRLTGRGSVPAARDSPLYREGQRPRCPIRRHTGNEDVAPPISLPLILYFPLTSTGFD